MQPKNAHEVTQSFVTPVIDDHYRSPALSSSSKLESRSLYERYRDSWYPEISAILLGAACLVAIAVVLGRFDRQFAPILSFGLTLNAIISVLATTSKALLLFTVSNAIGQLKWVWFNNDGTKSLSAAESYDNASRGPLGAVQILLSRLGVSFVAIGAVITILALTIDPFVQQIIVFDSELKYSNSSAAVVTQARFFDPWMYSQSKKDRSQTRFAGPLAASGLWGYNLEWAPDCPDGNCVWNDYQSLVWCTQCSRDRAWTLEGDCTIPTPSDISSGRNNSRQCIATSGMQSVSANISPTGSESAGKFYVTFPISNLTASKPWDSSRLEDALVTLSLVEWNVQQDLSLAATSVDCAIDICTQRSFLNMTNGELNFDLSTRDLTIKSVRYIDDSDYPSVCFEPADKGTLDATNLQKLPEAVLNSAIYTGQDQDLTFCIENFQASLQGIYVDLQGSRYARGSMQQTDNNTSAAPWPADFFDMPTWNNPYYMAQDTNYGNWTAGIWDFNSSNNYAQLLDKGLEHLVADLTAAMTKMMLDPNINVNGTTEITGMAGKTAPFVSIRWAWFALPACLWLVGFVFLLITMYITRRTRTPLWKCSTNALLYHGLDYGASSNVQLETISAMDRQALQSRARLTAPGNERRMLETMFIEQSEGIRDRRKGIAQRDEII